jgi:3-methyladenine DNA glycosylase AlkC
MAEALKHLYSQDVIKRLAKIVHAYNPQNSEKKIIALIFDMNWEDRELKSRMSHISDVLHQSLTQNYKKDIEFLIKIAPEFSGFEGMFIPHYIECFGLENWDISIKAIEHTTEYASAEFAVRKFILRDKERMMQKMLSWSKHKNHHLRRLSSEGCRPRLPWACALPEFKQDPRLIIPILDQLKNDTSLYVRKSVANNINDISKDNPNLVLDLIRLWKGNSAEQDWVLKHGARTLLKRSDKSTLRLFGNEQPKHIEIDFFEIDESVKIGEELDFKFSLKSKKELGKLRLEYKIGFLKASGKTSYKVFKISEGNYTTNSLTILKHHHFKQLTTRKHYPGQHEIIILVNGVVFCSKQFQVL